MHRTSKDDPDVEPLSTTATRLARKLIMGSRKYRDLQQGREVQDIYLTHAHQALVTVATFQL